MSQIERGGHDSRRWAAEFPETDNPEGSVGEEMREGDEQSARLEALPEHEQDPNDAVGGGMMSSGGTAADYGRSHDQPVPGEDAPGGDTGDSGIDADDAAPSTLGQTPGTR